MDRLYSLAHHDLKEVQIDAAFYTEEIKRYFEERQPNPIKALVTAPHEHTQNGAAEVNVKVFKQGIMKQLHCANLVVNSWWGDCAHWFNDCRIRGPSPFNDSISIAEAWDGMGRVLIYTTRR